MQRTKWMVKLVVLLTVLLIAVTGCTYEEEESEQSTKSSNAKITFSVYASNEQDPQDLAEYAIDGDQNTMWHTQWWDAPLLPQSITIVISEPVSVNKFIYLPRQDFHDWGDPQRNGIVEEYEIQSSLDGENFKTVAEGVWEWGEERELRVVNFDPVEATHIRFVVYAGEGGFASAAEIELGYERL